MLFAHIKRVYTPWGFKILQATQSAQSRRHLLGTTPTFPCGGGLLMLCGLGVDSLSRSCFGVKGEKPFSDRLAELLEGFFFDLADSFAGETEVLSYFF